MSLLTLATSIVAVLLVPLAWVFWLILRDAMNKEAAAVIPERTRSLIERAKNRLPEEARPRWEEEWPAGFADAIDKRPVWALREAISLYRGARKIAAELKPAVAPASSHKGMARPAISSVKARATYAKLIARLRIWLGPSYFETPNRTLAWAFNAIDRAVVALLKPVAALATSSAPLRAFRWTLALGSTVVVAILITQLLKL